MRSFSDYLSTHLPGKVRKIAVNAGLGCPNRDGTAGSGGCIFCNNDAFCPRYTSSGKSISEQIEDGIRFFAHKGRADSYLVYFQSFSNTYGETPRLISLYEEALAFPGVSGLVIATRPDCLKPDLLDYLERRFSGDDAPFLLMELGVESTNDSTLRLVNRGHDYACAEHAIRELAGRGIAVGVHVILGLPGETEADFINHARRLSALPVSTVKLHQLQVIEGTVLADMYKKDPETIKLMSPEDYACAVKAFLSELREDICIDRLVSETPGNMVIAPSWGLKPSEFLRLVTKGSR